MTGHPADYDALVAELRAIADHWEREYMPTDSGWVEICHRDLVRVIPPEESAP